MKIIPANPLLLLPIILATFGCGRQDDGKANNQLEIDASRWGRFQHGYSWEFSVGADRKATITIYKPGGDLQRSFLVSPMQVEKVDKSLTENTYFELPAQIGKDVPDGSTSKIRIKKGKQDKTIIVKYFPESETPAGELAIAKRAVRVLQQIESLFDDEDAAKYVGQ
jgi:hypothetical protein